MPVKVHADIRYLEQEEFGKIAYRVMDHAFSIHNEMGGFFDEHIYRDALADRVPGSQTEVLIDVCFQDFHKEYYIDLLVDGGGIFELKRVKKLGSSQRSQLLNYLLLSELSHGKLLNFHTKSVGHEFVNTHLKHSDRVAFRVFENNWLEPSPDDRPLLQWLVAFLRDVGTGLDVNLYEAAVTHRFGGDEAVLREVDIVAGACKLGNQKVRLIAPACAFKVTTLETSGLPRFEDHTRRFLVHTNLIRFHWINITRELITFTTIERK